MSAAAEYRQSGEEAARRQMLLRRRPSGGPAEYYLFEADPIVNTLAISANGTWLSSGSQDKTVRI